MPHVQPDRLEEVLHGVGEVLVMIGDGGLGHAWRAEMVEELLRDGRALAVIREPREVHPEEPVAGETHESPELPRQPVAAVRRQAHDLALVGVGTEAEV